MQQLATVRASRFYDCDESLGGRHRQHFHSVFFYCGEQLYAQVSEAQRSRNPARAECKALEYYCEERCGTVIGELTVRSAAFVIGREKSVGYSD